MKYLDTQMARVELYQVVGMDYQLMATGCVSSFVKVSHLSSSTVSLRELLDHHSTVFDTLPLVSVVDGVCYCYCHMNSFT